MSSLRALDTWGGRLCSLVEGVPAHLAAASISRRHPHAHGLLPTQPSLLPSSGHAGGLVPLERLESRGPVTESCAQSRAPGECIHGGHQRHGMHMRLGWLVLGPEARGWLVTGPLTVIKCHEFASSTYFHATSQIIVESTPIKYRQCRHADICQPGRRFNLIIASGIWRTERC